VAAEALSYLLAADVVVCSLGGADTFPAEFAEDHDPALAGWTTYGLMFHSRSRLGRHDDPIGALAGPDADLLPGPAVKPVEHQDAITLYRPDWDELVMKDPPLSVALEARRSTRSFRRLPLTAREVGELLYRCLRVRSLTAPLPGGSDDPAWERTDRPYPSAGSAYELEVYLTVAACTGIPSGVYHYDALGHRLELLRPEPAEELLECGRFAMDASAVPPLLITMTARFGRVLAEYSSLGYALTLKHVGVVMQTLYLVSEAMGLDACAIACGDIDAAARTFDLDWRTESSVGEMAIGRRTTREDSHPDGSWVAVNDADWPIRACRHGE
jgi:SagB-type dehydrogenase family enzyme